MKPYQIGMIGCGHMGMAIIDGALSAGLLKKEEITVYDHSERVQTICSEKGLHQSATIKDLAEHSSLVVLAITPQAMDGVLKELAGLQLDCVLSIAAAITMRHIASFLPPETAIIRVMPNTPLMVSCGATAICHNEFVKQPDLEFVRHLFDSLGIVRAVSEDQMDQLIAVNGSTPAYFYYFLNTMLEDAIRSGIEPETARALLVQTMIGSGKILQENPDIPIRSFIDAVCSKGGTTIEAVGVMEQSDFKDIIRRANEACIKRSVELKK